MNITKGNIITYVTPVMLITGEKWIPPGTKKHEEIMFFAILPPPSIFILLSTITLRSRSVLQSEYGHHDNPGLAGDVGPISGRHRPHYIWQRWILHCLVYRFEDIYRWLLRVIV